MTECVVLLGCGNWGSNLLRALNAEGGNVTAVIDPEPDAQRTAARIAPGVALHAHMAALPALRPDLVVIATPGPMHVQHARAALACGADVFVEKPMAMTVADARALTAEARRQGRIGMVGHLMHHHPAVRAMLGLLRAGAIGTLRKLTCVRVSMRGSRDTEGSVLWSLAPHDISLLLAIDPGPVTVLRARGLHGAAISTELRTAGGLPVFLQVSRAGARKVRRTELVGDRGTLVFDDALPAGKLRLQQDGRPPASVPYEEAEPLRQEMRELLRCVRDRVPPFAGFEQGTAVVEVLDRVTAAVGSELSSPPDFAL